VELHSILALDQFAVLNKAAKTGDVHHWKDGDYVKQEDGTWKKRSESGKEPGADDHEKIEEEGKKKPGRMKSDVKVIPVHVVQLGEIMTNASRLRKMIRYYTDYSNRELAIPLGGLRDIANKIRAHYESIGKWKK